jgi:hypothetical protein
VLQRAVRNGEHAGDHPDKQRPLIEFGRKQAAKSQAGLSSPGEDQGDYELGSLGGDGRQPLHQQELVDPQRLSGGNESFTKRFGAGQDNAARKQKHGRVRKAAPALWQ